VENERDHKVIETRSERIWLDQNGILRFQALPVDHNLKDAEENVKAAIDSFYEGKKRPCLIDICNVKSISADARQYYAGEETARIQCAAAILVHSNFTRIIANFFIGLNKTLFSTRIFSSEEEALTSLKGFIHE